MYPDPYAYKPERFLTTDGKLNRDVRDPSLYAFGVCAITLLCFAILTDFL